MQIERDPHSLAPAEPSPESVLPRSDRLYRLISQQERLSRSSFLWPSMLALLLLSVFPLIISLYLSFARFDLAKGGFKLTFIGLANYRKLLFGSERTHFLGLFGLVAVALAIFLARYLRSGAVSFGGLLGRVLLVAGLGALAWMFIHTFG